MINLLWQRGSSTSRKTLVCAISNEAGQLRTGSSNACFDQKSPVGEVADHGQSGDTSLERNMARG